LDLATGQIFSSFIRLFKAKVTSIRIFLLMGGVFLLWPRNRDNFWQFVMTILRLVRSGKKLRGREGSK
jgi:hypothetical protein